MSGTVTAARLADIADVNPRFSSALAPNDLVSFVPMSAVNADDACVNAPEERPFEQVKKGYTPFCAGDLLVAKITPCFENGKIAQATIPHQVGFGSTEFHVVRPKASEVDARYLLHFLRQRGVRGAGERRMTGSAGQRRVPEVFIADLQVPLPPLGEQRRIADVLDRAEALRAKCRDALRCMLQLAGAIFVEMFGDPGTNPHGWPLSTVANVATQVTDGEHQTPKRAPIGIKLLSARNVRDGYLDLTDVDHIGADEYRRIRRRCDPITDDVLISCSGTIGRVALVEVAERLSLVRSVALVRPNTSLVRPRFLEFYLRTPALRARMLQRANASSQANLFQGQIRELPVHLPPIALQQEFCLRATAVRKIADQQRAALAGMDALVASVQDRAFRGEL